jgi:hypothetical protein
MIYCFDHWELDQTDKEKISIPSSSSASSSSTSRSRKVQYAKTCAVILIPSKEEYFNAGIDLWFNRQDLKQSQYQASVELKHLMEYCPVLTMEGAMTYLYQPKIEIYYGNKICWFNGRNLNLLVIDKDIQSANDTINDVVNSQKNWKWSTCVAQTGENAIQMIKNGKQAFDIVIIDESIGGDQSLSFIALVSIFRSIFGLTVFIGCTIRDPLLGVVSNTFSCTTNTAKFEALKSG